MTLLNFILLTLVMISLYALLLSFKQIIKHHKEDILRKSQQLGIKTMGKAFSNILIYPSYHPGYWMGKLLLKINDLQESFHKYLMIKL